jgi:hypothetical protein
LIFQPKNISKNFSCRKCISRPLYGLASGAFDMRTTGKSLYLRLLAFALAGGAFASAGAAAQAQTDVTCTDLTLYAPNSGETVVSVPVSAQTLLSQCKSASGASLYLVSPTEGFTAELEPQSSSTQVFVVSNIRGEQARATVTVIRK